jgi:hypothetical protein
VCADAGAGASIALLAVGLRKAVPGHRVDAAGNALPLTGDAIVPLFDSNWKLCTASSEVRLLQFKMARRSTVAGCLATAEAAAALALCLPHLALMHHNVTSAAAVCVGLLSHCC